MQVDIVVPQVGEAVAEVTLVRWLKRPGDAVRRGEPLFEVDTDKTLVEVEAFVEGVLAEILVRDGSDIMPRDVVGRIETDAAEGTSPGETASRDEAVAASSVTEADGGPIDTDSSYAGSADAEAGVSGIPVPDRPAPERPFPDGQEQAAERILASPRARLTAERLGIDLHGLIGRGSGPGGLIQVRDVERSSDAGRFLIRSGGLSRMRRTIAERTLNSKRTVPHFYLNVEVDMMRAGALRESCRHDPGWPSPPTWTDLIVRAAALAIRGHPESNVQYEERGLIRRESVDIGVAVALEEGLVVPVLRGADRLGLRETAASCRGLAVKAREGCLADGDLGLKSLTVSNLGMYGVDSFIAIIDAPDPLILAVGRVSARPTAVQGRIEVRPMCTLTLSVDHRAIDGKPAAELLQGIRRLLEEPVLLLGESEP